MKVKDLIAMLGRFDGDLDVILYCEDTQLLQPGFAFRLFDVEDANVQHAELTRPDEVTPYLRFGESSRSRPRVILSITSDI
jgi:hypothetical protein